MPKAKKADTKKSKTKTKKSSSPKTTSKKAASKPASKSVKKSPAKKSPSKKRTTAKKQTRFAKIFLDSLREGDKQLVGADHLSRIIAHHEFLSEHHKNGQIHIDVCNPTEQSHGWFGLHTVINLVSDDMVFLIDSITSYIAEKSYLIEQILHPHIYHRPLSGNKVEYVEKRQAVEEHLSSRTHLYIQLNRRLTEAQMEELEIELYKIVSDVRLATRDWRLIKSHLHQIKEDLPPLVGQDVSFFGECKQFLQYIHDDNFTLLGCRDYKITGSGKNKKLKIVPESGLGLFSPDRLKEYLSDVDYNQFVMNLDVRKDFPQLFITKLVKKSPVHRRVPVDVIVVRHFDNNGDLTGESHFIGLFTSVTYSRGISTVPYLWYKVDHVLKRAGFEAGEHSERALRHILEKYPRDELFQISEERLYTACMDILRLQEKPRIALFVRPDIFGRTISCLVYIPRDRYDTRIRIRFSMILEEEMNAEFIGFQSAVDDSPLVRTSFTLSCTPDMKHDYDLAKIEARLQKEGQNWAERLSDRLVEKLTDEDEAADLAFKYAASFPISYQETHQARQAVHDIMCIEEVLKDNEPDVDLFKPYDAGNDRVSLKIYSPKDLKMKFTLSWLKEHLETNATLDEIVGKLTDVGLEVEGVEDRAEKYAPFKVAEVLEAEPHPDADRLKVCQVKTVEGVLQVVCGAPNARKGMKAVFAPAGTYIPGLDVTLKKTKIRGQESNGMMVSEREMELGDNHTGIIDLPADTEVGTPMADIFGLNDPVIEINVTPNRPDCAGVRGIARDLAAAGLGTLKPLPTPNVGSKFDSAPNVILQFDEADKQACPLFIGRLIKGVKNGPSPDWLQQRLQAVGLRPISALVDITNYFCVGLARPLHVFDADKLTGDLHVRMSKKGEELEALNDKSYTLDDGAVVIADDSGVLGLGGIVGGTKTGCEDNTTNVYLECAYFDPMQIARTGRNMQIISDARYRFERGVDPQFTVDAMELATQMILDLCGGEAGTVIKAGDVPPCTTQYKYDSASYKKLVGEDVSESEQKQILESLGFTVAADWTVTAPPWRPDILGSVDLIEEIARIKGYENITPRHVVKDSVVAKPAETSQGEKMRKARNALSAKGLQECYTWSFMAEDLAHRFGANDQQQAARLKLVNPISSELVQMRPSILPNLIDAAGRNADRGYPNAALFEVGPVFQGADANEHPIVACGIRTGSMNGKHWSGTEASRDVDIYDAKQDVLNAIAACGGPAANLQVTRDAPSYYHPGRSGAMRLGKNVVAYFGEIHPAILDGMKIDDTVVGFELFIGNIPEPKKKGTAMPLADLFPFQPVSRDFAFLADAGVDAESFTRAIKFVDRNLISDVEIFDIYTGQGIEDGKKSVAITVTLQPRTHTLTDAEIDGICQKIVAVVEQKTGATLRG